MTSSTLFRMPPPLGHKVRLGLELDLGLRVARERERERVGLEKELLILGDRGCFFLQSNSSMAGQQQLASAVFKVVCTVPTAD